jgi:septum site-determining protein MinD
MARVYAIASAKGGVGKTTTTANLGATLAGAGADVVVIDGDIGMANLGAALGVRPHGATLHDALSGSVEPVAAAYEGPAGLTVVPGDTSLEAFSAADPQQLQGVVDAFDDADYVLIDVGAGVSHETSVPLSVADAVVLVSTAERDALVDTEKTRQLTDRLGGVVAGAVLTRTDEGAPIEEIVSGTLTAEVLATIPEDEAVRESIAVGEPLLSYAPHSDAAAAYRQLATKLTGIELSPPTVDTDSHTENAPADGTPDTGATDETAPETTVVGDSPETDAVDDVTPAPDAVDDATPAPDATASTDSNDQPSTGEGGVTIDPGTDPTGDTQAATDQNTSDDEHNVVNPFAATPKDDAPVTQPDEGESKWAEAATGTRGDADSDDIRIDPEGAYDASDIEADPNADATAADIEIDPTDRDTTADSDDAESDEESVPRDAIPFGGDDEDDKSDQADDTSQTTVLGAALDEEADGAEATADSGSDAADSDNSDETDDSNDSDDGPLIPDAEETAAANAETAVDDEADDENEAPDDDDEEKRGFFSRLFR